MCVAAFKQLHWQRDNQAAAQAAYDAGESNYQGYKFFDQANPRTSLYEKGFTMLAPGRTNLATPTKVVNNLDGTRTYGGVANAFTQPQAGGATRVIS